MVGIDTDIFTTIPNIRREVLFANKGAGFHRTCELSVGRLVLLKRVNANIRTEAFPFREKISVLCDDILYICSEKGSGFSVKRGPVPKTVQR